MIYEKAKIIWLRLLTLDLKFVPLFEIPCLPQAGQVGVQKDLRFSI
jgi:hypothetical protein